MARYIQGSCGVANIDNDDRVRAEDVTYTAAPGYPPGTDDVQEALDYLVGAAPSVASMTPVIEGVAYGESSAGRTLLGYQVDNTSNSIGLWCSSIGAAQEISNSSSSVTAAFDTTVGGSQLQNGVYITQTGSLKNSDMSNSLLVARNSVLENQADWTEDTLLLNGFTANALDSVTRSVGIMSGQFVTDSQFDESLLIGDMTRLDGSNVSGCIVLRAPGPVGTMTVADRCCYLGNGQHTAVLNTGDFMAETYNRYYLKTLAPATGAETEYVVYDSVSGEMSSASIPTPTTYTLPLKQPNTLGGQYGISSLGNASEVNGRASFANYSAGPVQLSGVSSVGSSQFQTNSPGLTAFTNCIFLGRTHSFNALQSITDSLLAANIVTGSNISQVVNSNIIVPKAGSLTMSYAGAITGTNIVSSGAVSLVSDPLYSTVLASGGSVQPAASNLVLSANQGAGAISMNGQGNSLIQSAGTSVSYSWPVGVSNSCVLHNGSSVVLPSASSQLCSNHSSLRMPNINAAGIADVNTLPMAFNSGTGLISPTLSSLLSRVYRAVGTTTAGGQVSFTPGGSVNPSTVGYAFNATVRNASTTVAYTAQINAVTATTVTIQVYNSVTVVLASPSMVPAPAGIIVHFSMCY